MAGETDTPEDAAARLEAALERIAARVGSRPLLPESPDAAGPAPPVEEITARLDALIDRLRAALGGGPGGKPD